MATKHVLQNLSLSVKLWESFQSGLNNTPNQTIADFKS